MNEEALAEAFGILGEMERNRAKYLAKQINAGTLALYLKHDAADLLKIATALQESIEGVDA